VGLKRNKNDSQSIRPTVIGIPIESPHQHFVIFYSVAYRFQIAKQTKKTASEWMKVHGKSKVANYSSIRDRVRVATLKKLYRLKRTFRYPMLETMVTASETS
jgi:hypothetical protein